MGIRLTARDIKAIDHFTINSIGIPSLVLMERAAIAITESLLKDYKHDNINIVCGPGNNGGDGIAIGRLLHQSGKTVTLFLVGDFTNASMETKTQLHIAEKLNMRIERIADEVSFDKNALIVDALFGIGLNREVENPYLAVIRAINQSENTILAVDIPSGLSADTGLVYNEAVKAEKTFAVGFWKKGFDTVQSKAYTGDVDVLSIGYPPEEYYLHLLESEDTNDESI